MRILNSAQLSAALSHAECIDALEPTMRAVSAEGAIMPLRQYLNIPGTAGKFTMMPGYVDSPRTFGFKVVSKYPREAGSPHGSHVGAVMIFDAEEGTPIAMVDGAMLTAIRTSAASALATRVLAREDSHRLAVLGSGQQAEHHIRAISCVRPIDDIQIWSRNPDNARNLLAAMNLPPSITTHVAESPADAVANADIVCTTTSARTPYLSASDFQPGTHINLVGAAIVEASEVSPDVVARSRFVTDYRPSAMAQAGELAAAIAQGMVDASPSIAEIGEILADKADGRQDVTEVTTYKSLGVAAQDLAAAWAAARNAEAKSLGVQVDW
ncbi:MAG: ornithine cyclodeaminase family protein [Woeseiaceae bacterium]